MTKVKWQMDKQCYTKHYTDSWRSGSNYSTKHLKCCWRLSNSCSTSDACRVTVTINLFTFFQLFTWRCCVCYKYISIMWHRHFTDIVVDIFWIIIWFNHWLSTWPSACLHDKYLRFSYCLTKNIFIVNLIFIDVKLFI